MLECVRFFFVLLFLATSVCASFKEYTWSLVRRGYSEKAFIFLSHLRAQGNVEAIHMLGHLILEKVVTVDGMLSQIANQLFYEAAKKNYPPAIKALGDAYFVGDGVPKNIALALIFYKKAADLGYGPAQFSAGELLEFVSCHESLHYFSLASCNKDLGPLQEDAERLRQRVKQRCLLKSNFKKTKEKKYTRISKKGS